MPKLRISKYLRVQSVGGTDRDASISPTGPQLLETGSTGDGRLARRRAVFGQHDPPSAAAGLARLFSIQTRI